MNDPKKPSEKIAAEEPTFEKYGVECNPKEPIPVGTKEASEGCGQCGGKHEE